MTFWQRLQRWLLGGAIKREEGERYMSQQERDVLDEQVEGLAADRHSEERYLGPLPREHDDGEF